MPLFWAALWAMFLTPPLKFVAKCIATADEKLGKFKLHVYLGTSAIYLFSVLTSSILGIVASTVIFSLWSFVLWGDRHTVSTILLFVGLTTVVAIPLYFCVLSCIEESKDIAQKISTFVEENPQFKTLLNDFGSSPYYAAIKDYAAKWDVEIPEFDPEVVKAKITDVSMQFSSYFTDALGSVAAILSDSVQFIVSFVTFISFLYTFLSTDADWAAGIKSFSPFSSDDNEKLFKSLNKSVVSVFMSSILIALSHMVGTYVVFKIADIDLALVLSVICGFTSVLPIVSSWIVWVPVAIGLFFTGNYVTGGIVVVVQVLLQGPVDSAIYGLIPGNTFLVSTSLAMGLYVFGTIGLVMGPLLAGITLTVIEIYKVYQSSSTLYISQERVKFAIPSIANEDHSKIVVDLPEGEDKLQIEGKKL